MIKAIKLHRKLRKQQELLFDECVKCSQIFKPFTKLNEYISVNKALRKVENRLPMIYFFIGDLFNIKFK
jgi:hypothetical protein